MLTRAHIQTASKLLSDVWSLCLRVGYGDCSQVCVASFVQTDRLIKWMDASTLNSRQQGYLELSKKQNRAELHHSTSRLMQMPGAGRVLQPVTQQTDTYAATPAAMREVTTVMGFPKE